MTLNREQTSRKAAPLLLANVVARLCGRRHRKDNQTVLSTVASSFPIDNGLGKRPRRQAILNLQKFETAKKSQCYKTNILFSQTQKQC